MTLKTRTSCPILLLLCFRFALLVAGAILFHQQSSLAMRTASWTRLAAQRQGGRMPSVITSPNLTGFRRSNSITAAFRRHDVTGCDGSRMALVVALSLAAASSSGDQSDPTKGEQGHTRMRTGVVACAPPSPNSKSEQDTISVMLPDHLIQYDSYNGVVVDLDHWDETESVKNNIDFATALSSSIKVWKQEGRRGIWIHLRASQSDKVHAAVQQGFNFHMVVDDNKLILSTWLPQDTPSRLPNGPTHQVGVGCLIFHPHDPSQMLVVQERTGPAAALKLWKMPTGLADPGEDIHDAAVRELKEETGLDASFHGILTFRQAHSTTSRVSGTTRRQNSDLFFVCQMELLDNGTNTTSDGSFNFQACPDEIAAIKWMPITEYCAQERWGSSPVYQEMNKAILEASSHKIFASHTLPLGYAPGTNTLYKSK